MERCSVRAAQSVLSRKAYGLVGIPMKDETSLPLCARNYMTQAPTYSGPLRPSGNRPYPPCTHLKPARLQIVIAHLLFVCLEEGGTEMGKWC